MLSEKQLLDLKKQVDDAKTTVSELKGQKNALSKQLLDEWKCKAIEEAKSTLISMEVELTMMDQSIKNGIEELEKKYING